MRNIPGTNVSIPLYFMGIEVFLSKAELDETQPPTWRASPLYLQSPGQGGPAIPPGTVYPF
jgi:hypothetical protein